MTDKILLIGGSKDGQRIEVPTNYTPLVTVKPPNPAECCTINAEMTKLPDLQVEHYNPMRFEGNGSMFVVYVEQSLKADAVLARLISNYKPK